MRLNISKVLDALSEGKARKGDHKGTCSTDGTKVFSYETEIARLLPGKRIWVTMKRYSRTTDSQCSAIQSYARLHGLTVTQSEECPQ